MWRLPASQRNVRPAPLWSVETWQQPLVCPELKLVDPESRQNGTEGMAFCLSACEAEWRTDTVKTILTYTVVKPFDISTAQFNISCLFALKMIILPLLSVTCFEEKCVMTTSNPPTNARNKIQFLYRYKNSVCFSTKGSFAGSYRTKEFRLYC